jgi:hypothetical protein
MECPTCKPPNVLAGKFCPDCGRVLDPAADLTKQVTNIIEAKFKDRALIEAEVSDKIITRLDGYFKIGGWVFGGATALLTAAIVIATYSGYGTLKDAKASINEAAAKATTASNNAATDFAEQTNNVRRKSADAEVKIDLAFAQFVEEIKRHQKEAPKNATVDSTAEALKRLVKSVQDANSFAAASLLPVRDDSFPLGLGSSGTRVVNITRRLRDLGCSNALDSYVITTPVAQAMIKYLKADAKAKNLPAPALTVDTVQFEQRMIDDFFLVPLPRAGGSCFDY